VSDKNTLLKIREWYVCTPLLQPAETKARLQGVYKSSRTNFQDTFFFKFQKIFTWQAIQCQMQAKFVMSINEHVMTSSDQHSSVCHLTCLLLYEQWTQQIRTSQSWDKVGYRENYIPNYKIFQKHQLDSTRFPVFPGAIWNSGDFQELQTPRVTSAGPAWFSSCGCVLRPVCSGEWLMPAACVYLFDSLL